MNFSIHAITLDLDDTLWPFAPIGARVERVLDQWLRTHCPATALRYPIAAMRELREAMYRANPQLAHDLSALRRMSIEQALRESGDDPAHAEAAFDLFYAERNRVDFYEDSLDALQRIADIVPVVALSNGNADLNAIGIGHLFTRQLSAREHGAAKPHPSIFLAACRMLDLAPHNVLHVGDDIETDVLGAAHAGLRTCWINRNHGDTLKRTWLHAEIQPDLIFDTLGALAARLEENAPSVIRSSISRAAV